MTLCARSNCGNQVSDERKKFCSPECYREDHRRLHREYMKHRRATDPQFRAKQLESTKNWIAKNPERVKEYNRRWRETRRLDPEYRELERLRSEERARKKGVKPRTRLSPDERRRRDAEIRRRYYLRHPEKEKERVRRRNARVRAVYLAALEIFPELRNLGK